MLLLSLCIVYERSLCDFTSLRPNLTQLAKLQHLTTKVSPSHNFFYTHFLSLPTLQLLADIKNYSYAQNTSFNCLATKHINLLWDLCLYEHFSTITSTVMFPREPDFTKHNYKLFSAKNFRQGSLDLHWRIWQTLLFKATVITLSYTLFFY